MYVDRMNTAIHSIVKNIPVCDEQKEQLLRSIQLYPLPVQSFANLMELDGCTKDLATFFSPWPAITSPPPPLHPRVQSQAPEHEVKHVPRKVVAPPTSKIALSDFMSQGAPRKRPRNSVGRNFSVKIVVDKRENVGHDRSKFHALFPNVGADLLHAKLPQGDFTFVLESGDREMILPIVIERKRLDDLAHTIISPRYQEQKMSLKSSSIKKVVFIVENYPGLRDEERKRIQSACKTIMLIDNFYLISTSDTQDTAKVITDIAEQLTILGDSLCQKGDVFDGFQSFFSLDKAASLQEFIETEAAAMESLEKSIIFPTMISVVRSCSSPIAISIAESFGSAEKLFEALVAHRGSSTEFAVAEMSRNSLEAHQEKVSGQTKTYLEQVSAQLSHIFLERSYE